VRLEVADHRAAAVEEHEDRERAASTDSVRSGGTPDDAI
jgi:hypothetical protein